MQRDLPPRTMHQPVFPRRVQVRRQTPDELGQFGTIMALGVALAAGIYLLIAVDGSPPGRGPNVPIIFIGLTFLGTVLVLTYASLSKKIRLSLQISLIYFSLFLLLPGYHHATTNIFPFYDLPYAIKFQTQGALIIAIFIAAMVFSYTISESLGRKYSAPKNKNEVNDLFFIPRLNIAWGLTFLSYAMAAIYLAAKGFDGAFSTRGSGLGNGEDLSTAAIGLLSSLPRILTFLSFYFGILIFKFSISQKKGALFIFLNILPFLICNWPLALARFVLFGYLLILLVALADFRTPKRRLILTAAFSFGALIIMPVANSLTRGGNSVGNLQLGNLFDRYFQSGDFDGMQSAINAVVYVAQNGIQWGTQLLSALLFFVPRSIWTGKMPPTGSITSEAAGYQFFNISQPLPSEFFVDFGFFGVFVGAVVVGWALYRIDRTINCKWDLSVSSRVIAGLVVGYSIIILRGSLLSVIATTSTSIVCGLLLARFGIRGLRPRRRRVYGTPSPARPGSPCR